MNLVSQGINSPSLSLIVVISFCMLESSNLRARAEEGYRMRPIIDQELVSTFLIGAASPSFEECGGPVRFCNGHRKLVLSQEMVVSIEVVTGR